eukprot:TRINITY_DN981_c0_g1_i2.p1 TRINITY_DN981_c0_g1~~TRINITY_DN981_c0_g1_i2.p1  ORF type:complete len:116 (-),score=30.45 TRINITY_DN981_c0_g1_i2:20-367(-)
MLRSITRLSTQICPRQAQTMIHVRAYTVQRSMNVQHDSESRKVQNSPVKETSAEQMYENHKRANNTSSKEQSQADSAPAANDARHEYGPGTTTKEAEATKAGVKEERNELKREQQ